MVGVTSSDLGEKLNYNHAEQTLGCCHLFALATCFLQRSGTLDISSGIFKPASSTLLCILGLCPGIKTPSATTLSSLVGAANIIRREPLGNKTQPSQLTEIHADDDFRLVNSKGLHLKATLLRCWWMKN